MNGMIYLASALALVWSGVAIYLVRLAFLRRDLERRVGLLEGRPRTSRIEP